MRWMWIDRVVELEKGERLVAVKNVSLAEEHLHDHFAADEFGEALPVMPSTLILEGMAQSAGILVGHAESFREKVILAKIGKAEVTRDATPGTTLRYTAQITRMDAAGAATSGTIELLDHARVDAGFERIGGAEMMFSHLDQNRSGMVFPEHNFVFGEGFKTLLRTSGIAVD